MLTVSLYGDGKFNRALSDILACRSGVSVRGPFGRGDRDVALRQGTDAVVIATTSFLVDIAEDVLAAVTSGSNVLTTAEEAAFPFASDAKLVADLDAAARAHGVSILGTGLNPGFAFDSFVVAAAGASRAIESVRVERVVDLSGFSETILRRLGLGFSREEFDNLAGKGEITGHIGFPQSMRLVGQRLGIDIDRIDRSIIPIVADEVIQVESLTVPRGFTSGIEQRYTARAGGASWFEAVFVGHLRPAAVGLETRDDIFLSGVPPIRVSFSPGLDPQISAPAVAANSLPNLVNAAPGWRLVTELPPAAPWALPHS
jgi:2,4-diaminopentanoate dehydrogenase